MRATSRGEPSSHCTLKSSPRISMRSSSRSSACLPPLRLEKPLEELLVPSVALLGRVGAAPLVGDGELEGGPAREKATETLVERLTCSGASPRLRWGRGRGSRNRESSAGRPWRRRRRWKTRTARRRTRGREGEKGRGGARRARPKDGGDGRNVLRSGRTIFHGHSAGLRGGRRDPRGGARDANAVPAAKTLSSVSPTLVPSRVIISLVRRWAARVRVKGR